MNLPTARTPREYPAAANSPLICFSHLRWDFVLQRPQHLMQRFARQPPGASSSRSRSRPPPPALSRVPRLRRHRGHRRAAPRARSAGAGRRRRCPASLDEMCGAPRGTRPILWFYTPMMCAAGGACRRRRRRLRLHGRALANFRFAPPELAAREAELMQRADVVFTGGHSIYEAKREAARNVHAFPSSVDVDALSRGRAPACEAPPTGGHPGPRLGYYGVIDERHRPRSDRRRLRRRRPDWTFVMVGPVVKIDPASLPRAPNIHWLGQRPMRELPAYVAGWDVALMPFALNEATRFISPTKTPEYLAAGKPVVSTPVRDVVRSYGDLTGVRDRRRDAEQFVAGCEAAVAAGRRAGWLRGGRRDRWPAHPGTHPCRDGGAGRRRSSDGRRGRSRPSERRPVRRRRRSRPPYDYLVAGAGFAGSVLAERLASASGRRVFVCDTRPHVAGNAYDAPDAAGILVHRYGPHIFHTNREEIVAYLSRFTAWRPYEHRVLARRRRQAAADADQPHDPQRALRPRSFRRRGRRARCWPPAPSRSTDRDRPRRGRRAGRPGLYRTFFEGYTRKQWGLDPVRARQVGDRAGSRRARRPTTAISSTRYPGDAARRVHADVREHARSSAHPPRRLGIDYRGVAQGAARRATIYTGPIDAYLRPPLRRAALPQPRVPSRDARPPSSSSRSRSSTIPPKTSLHADHRIQASDRAEPSARRAISYEFARTDGEPYLSDPASREPGPLQAVRGARPGAARRRFRRPARHLPATTIWTRWWARRSPRSAASAAEPPASPRSRRLREPGDRASRRRWPDRARQRQLGAVRRRRAHAGARRSGSSAELAVVLAFADTGGGRRCLRAQPAGCARCRADRRSRPVSKLADGGRRRAVCMSMPASAGKATSWPPPGKPPASPWCAPSTCLS